MKIFGLFKIRREEWLPAVLMLMILVGLNVLAIVKYAADFMPLKQNYWNSFIGKFHVSGFDAITYYVVSDWEARYNVYRHPLLSFFMWPPYAINQLCMSLFGINCAQFIVALMLVFAAFYGFIFMRRICRDVIGLGSFDSSMFGFMLYSFAYVALAAMVPDHFIFSMFALLLTLYVSGMMIKERRRMSVLQTWGLFFLTAGISLNNGLKVFLSGLFVNKRRFFRPFYLAFAVILPCALIWIGARTEYHYLVAPNETARHKASAALKAEAHKRDSIRLVEAAKQRLAEGDTAKAAAPKPKKARQPRQGKPFMQGEFMRWSDETTARWPSIVENLFGESIMLHPDYLLQDEFTVRPMIVKYRWAGNYAVEGLIVLLFVLGVWCGRRNCFLWLAVSFFALDMALHVGLGFGLNEVYIMSAHWIYVIPIAIGYLLKALERRPQMVLRALLVMLTVGLYAYNGYFIIKYMTC